jgi:riboflavin transporter FmnP
MNTKKMTRIGVLATLALVLATMVHFPLIPSASYLQYDLGDIPALVGAFALGPAAGLVIAGIASVCMALFTGLGGPIGAIMHFLATGSFAYVAGLAYRKTRSQRGAIQGLIGGIIALTVLMVAANLVITPIYLKVPRPQVIAMLIPAIIPFNIAKGILSSVITLIIYKRLSPLLK